MSETDTTPADPACCSACGTPLEPRALGSKCPRCLLTLASLDVHSFADEVDHRFLDPLQVRDFGDYELLEEIARGGMGVVYRARQVSLDREVAIKMILAGELAGKEALRMFQTEAQASANLHHPNIVPVYEIGEVEMQHYFSMRYVPGGMTIAHWASTQRENTRAIAAVTAKVARAVAHAHERGVLHRDLKPSNILWDPSGEPQVSDFGLAKLLNAADGRTSLSVHLIGSPSYMAPEQTGGNAGGITTLTDVYGLGAVLYELLAGHPPFAGRSLVETARQVSECSPPPLPAKLPKDLRTVCLKCLAKNPSDRYSSAAALAEDLERFSRGESVSASPLSTAKLLWRWAKKKPALATLLALFPLSLLAGVTGVAWEWRKAEYAREEQARALANLEWQQIGHWLDDGDTARALASLSSLLREHPDQWQAAMYAMSIVDQHPFPMMKGPEITPPSRLVAPARLAADASWIAGAGEDHGVRIWSTATGQEIAHFSQSVPITALACSSGPWVLAYALDDGSVLTYSSLTAPSFILHRSSAGKIVSLQFSADGSALIGRSRDSLEIWRSNSPETGSSVLPVPWDIKDSRISGDGRRVVAWGVKNAGVWNTASGEKVLSLEAKNTYLNGCISADGSHMALIDGAFSAQCWDIDLLQPLASLQSPLAPWREIALNATGTRLTLAGTGNDLAMYETRTGLRVNSSMKHHYSIRNLATSSDGARLASSGWDDVVKTWDANDGKPLFSGISFGKLRPHTSLELSDDQSVLVHREAEKGLPDSLSVWRASRTLPPRRFPVAGKRNFDGCRLSPDGRLACLGLLPEYRCRVFELATGKVRLDKKAMGPVYIHLFSPDQQRYYVVTANGWLHGWSLVTGEELWPPNQQPGHVCPAEISADGKRIIIGHSDGHIRIHDTETGKLLTTLDHPGDVRVLRLAPDRSGRFVSGSTLGTARIWDLNSGRKLADLSGHELALDSADWSPDCRYVATASYDRTARLWDAVTGQPFGPPLPHLAWLSDVRFSPNGQLLATGCRDGTARLWHPLRGTPASPPLHQGNTIHTVCFTSDGSCLLVRDLDGFRFWDTQTGLPVTIHYQEPETSGIAMDSESWRSILTPDGNHVFLAEGMNDGAFWTIEHPHGQAPAWFPDFLECLCLLRLGEHDTLSAVDGRKLRDVKAKILQDGSSEYATWAKRVME